MISEYAVGRRGWVMTLCFASFAVASVGLLIALVPYTRGVLGRAGLGFLLLAAVGLAIGGAFTMDPSTTRPESMSFSGRMHGVGFTIGVPGELLAVLLLSLALRKHDAWSAQSLLALTVIAWVSVLIIAALMTRQWFFAIGIPNRIFMVAYALWIIVAAYPIVQGAASSPGGLHPVMRR
jgi:hypothetical protein